MNRQIIPLAAALLLAACADPTSVTTQLQGSAVPAPSKAVVLPTCPGCVFGPVQYTRTLGVRYEQVDFATTPGAYVMVVTDDGVATTGVEVLLNGTQLVGKADLLGAPTELRLPVSLLASNRLLVRMHGPLGARATVHFEPAEVPALTIIPDPVEKLPGGTQQFTVSGGSGGPYVWSVNGTDGGNATFGTITAGGFYTAPAAVPTPATFQVCAREVADPSVTGCATVTINPIPSAGADVVVFNDVNMTDAASMVNANNQRMVRNLVNFTGTGPRAGGTVVVMENGHNSDYVNCFSTAAQAVITAEGYTMQVLASAVIGPQPANVKVLILCLPRIAYSVDEINNMKLFAAQGGRIIFVGEHGLYYPEGIPIENQFLEDMGAVMRNVGEAIDCGYHILPSSSLRPHQVTEGMTELSMACASVIVPGPNDFVLFYDLSGTKVLGGVAKVDVTPLPAASIAGRASAVPGVNRRLADRPPTHDPVGRPIGRQ